MCISALVICFAGSLAAAAEVGRAESGKGLPARPNIVVIIADDLGYGELGCYGGREIPTLHMDRLAAGGVRFTNGYVTAPFCAASRAGLLTGRYQTRFGFEFNPIGARNADPQIGLPISESTFVEEMRAAGYVTALVGKWHLGGTAAYHPQRRGFDEFFGFLHEGHYYVPPPWPGHVTWLRRAALPDGGQGRWVAPDGRVIWSTHMGHREPDYDADNPVLRSSQPVGERDNLTDAFTREACDFITRQRSQPFCLCLAYSAVHSPLQAADRYFARFASIGDVQRRLFAAMLAQLDDGVGQVLEQLARCGLEERTLVVFLSDNGGPTKELTSSNAPLRGGKGDLFEGGIRVPFVVSWKSKVPAGQVIDEPVVSLDISATALAAAGSAFSGDGIDLLPALTQVKPLPAGRTLYWRVGGRQALRAGAWKLLRTPRGGGAAARWQLYDLANDVQESTDRATQQPALVRQLAEDWERWNAEQRPPLWR